LLQRFAENIRELSDIHDAVASTGRPFDGYLKQTKISTIPLPDASDSNAFPINVPGR
jgi:hypothetical protein